MRAMSSASNKSTSTVFAPLRLLEHGNTGFSIASVTWRFVSHFIDPKAFIAMGCRPIKPRLLTVAGGGTISCITPDTSTSTPSITVHGF
jgi:hypothetical protein